MILVHSRKNVYIHIFIFLFVLIFSSPFTPFPLCYPSNVISHIFRHRIIKISVRAEVNLKEQPETNIFSTLMKVDQSVFPLPRRYYGLVDLVVSAPQNLSSIGVRVFANVL